MSDRDTFERILALLHDATFDDSHWPATSALIDEACGTVGNALLTSEARRPTSRPNSPADLQTQFAGLYYRGQRAEDLEQEWLDVYDPINEGVSRLLQLPDSQIVPTADLYTAEELKTSRAYNEGLRRFRGQRGVTARLDGPAGCTITWVSGDPVSSHGWESSQLALLKGLLPHIRQFVRTRQALSVSELGLLDNLRVGVIYMDRCGCIVEANDRARALLRQGDAVTDRGRKLGARRPADHARLEWLLAGAVPTSSAPAVSGSMTLRRTAGLPPLVVHVEPVRARQPNFSARRVGALVLITEPGHTSGIDPALIAEALGLTPAESQVAAGIAEGRSVREVAGALGQTTGTTRWHLHHIYDKHGLARQADLVRLVLSVAPFA